MRLFLMGHRDFDDDEPFEKLPVTSDVETFHSFSNNLMAYGEGDAAEDDCMVFSVLRRADSQVWFRDPSDFCEPVTTAVSMFVTKSLDESKRGVKGKNLTLLLLRYPLVWSTRIDRNVHVYGLPKAVDDVLNNVTPERETFRGIGIKPAQHPFAEGAKRIAHYGFGTFANCLLRVETRHTR
jgi:hypothetical protein